jgi:Ca2+-binding RTX toxin-like protein
VQSPLAIHADFNDGASDLSDISNDVVVGSEVTFEGEGDDLALRLNNGTVTYARSTDLIGNSEYTLQVDFKKDPGSEGSGGTLVYFSSSFVVNIAADGLSVMVGSDQGNSWLKPTGVGINDAEWHRLALTFSGDDGAAILYLDGVEVARLTGLDGAIQTGSSSHDFVLGNPFDPAKSFAGLIDNVQFWKGAMSADQIEALAIRSEDGSFAPLASGESEPVADDGETEPVADDGETEPVADDGETEPVADDGETEPVADDGESEPTGDDSSLEFDESDFDQVIIGGDGDDNLVGGRGADLIYAGGGNNTLRGQNGDDVLIAGDGNDTLLGGNGNDILIGGGGINELNGGNGHDLLISGLGLDIMTGGKGNDTFKFNSVAGSRPGEATRDQITDFTPGEDKIDVSAIDAIVGGDHDAFTFIGTAAFSAAGQLRQSQFENGVLIEGDIDGDGIADFEIALLTPGLVLTAEDFVL